MHMSKHSMFRGRVGVTTSVLGVQEMVLVVYVRQEEQREFGACSTYCTQLNAAPVYTA